MEFTLTQVLIWIVIAAVIGFLGELIARRRTPGGILGAIIVGLIAIFVVVGLLHFRIAGEPELIGVPIITSILAAAILVAIWSAFAYRRVQPYYARYSQRGSPGNRSRRSWFSRS